MVVIDLSRLPSQGRDVAMAIRSYKATRQLPILFVDGDPKKVAQIKTQLPDVVYTSWTRIRRMLKYVLAHPLAQPVKARSRLEGYAGTSLAKKLGIKATTSLNLVGAPQGFEKELGDLPEQVLIRRNARERSDITVWFTRSRDELEGDIKRMAAFSNKGGLWIAWPKQSSGTPTDLSQGHVRHAGLAAGMVDYKICSINATWSALRFTLRVPRHTMVLSRA